MQTQRKRSWNSRKKQPPWDTVKGSFKSSLPHFDHLLYVKAHTITDSALASIYTLVKRTHAARRGGEPDPKFTATQLGRTGASMDMMQYSRIKGVPTSLHGTEDRLCGHVYTSAHGANVYWATPLAEAFIELVEQFYPQRLEAVMPAREYEIADKANLQGRGHLKFALPPDSGFLFIGTNSGGVVRQMIAIDDETAPVLKKALEAYMTRPEKR